VGHCRRDGQLLNVAEFVILPGSLHRWGEPFSFR